MKKHELGPRSLWFDSTHQFFGSFPRVRTLFAADAVPAFASGAITAHHELESQTNDEIEETYRLTEEQTGHAQDVLERQGANRFPDVVIDATWYDLSAVQDALSDPAKIELCSHLEPRIRSKTDNATGEVKWFWTVKINGNPDGVSRPETEGDAHSREAAHQKLREAIQQFLDLDGPPELDTLSLAIVKTRVSYRYDDPKGEPRPCTGSQIDFDVWTKLQGQELVPPVITVDIEGPSEERVRACRHCLQTHTPEGEEQWARWTVAEILKERGVAK